MPKEIWREVPGYPGLRASSLGRVWLPERFARGRTYKTKPTFGVWASTTGGGRFIYYSKLFRKNLKVARMVCLAFHGEPPPGRPCCLHADEDARNNRPSNLSWGSQKENLNAPGYLAYCASRTGDNSPTRKGRMNAAIPASDGMPLRGEARARPKPPP